MTHAMTETTTPLPVAAPCEHCGSTDIFIEREDLSAYQARCNDCGSRGPIVEEGRYYDNEEAGQRDAIIAWNRRAAPAAMQDDAIAAAASAYERLYIDTEGQCSADDVARAVLSAAPSPAPAALSAAQPDAMTTCITCQGFGSRAHPDDPHPLPCPDCDGTGAQPAQGGSVSEAAAEIDEDDIAALMAWKYACTTRQASPDRDTMTEWWDRLDDWEKCGFREGAVAAMSALSAARASAPEVVEALEGIATDTVAVGLQEVNGRFVLKADRGTKGNVVGEGGSLVEATANLRAALRSAGEEANG